MSLSRAFAFNESSSDLVTPAHSFPITCRIAFPLLSLPTIGKTPKAVWSSHMVLHSVLSAGFKLAVSKKHLSFSPGQLKMARESERNHWFLLGFFVLLQTRNFCPGICACWTKNESVGWLALWKQVTVEKLLPNKGGKESSLIIRTSCNLIQKAKTHFDQGNSLIPVVKSCTTLIKW